MKESEIPERSPQDCLDIDSVADRIKRLKDNLESELKLLLADNKTPESFKRRMSREYPELFE